MSRKARLPQSRRHIFVYDEDWEFLHQAYGPGTITRLGVSGAIREIIHVKVVSMKGKLEQTYDRLHREKREAGLSFGEGEGEKALELEAPGESAEGEEEPVL